MNLYFSEKSKELEQITIVQMGRSVARCVNQNSRKLFRRQKNEYPNPLKINKILTKYGKRMGDQ